MPMQCSCGAHNNFRILTLVVLASNGQLIIVIFQEKNFLEGFFENGSKLHMLVVERCFINLKFQQVISYVKSTADGKVNMN